MESILWVDKYKPNSLSEIISNGENIKKIQKWFMDYENGVNTKSGVLISGIPGCGKTSLARAIGLELNYDIQELNASDTRSKKKVKELLHFINTYKSVTSILKSEKKCKSLVIMDEIDGMSSGDRGGLNELEDLLKSKLNIPIICICNKRKSKNINDLARYCLDISFDIPKKEDMLELANKILKLENKHVSDEIILTVIKHSNNDIRHMLHILYEIEFHNVNQQLVTSVEN